MGIFATRSPARPNPIALSTAQVIRIDHASGVIQIAYTDADNQTPVLDIKPTPQAWTGRSPAVPDWCSHWPKVWRNPAGLTGKACLIFEAEKTGSTSRRLLLADGRQGGVC